MIVAIISGKKKVAKETSFEARRKGWLRKEMGVRKVSEYEGKEV